MRLDEGSFAGIELQMEMKLDRTFLAAGLSAAHRCCEAVVGQHQIGKGIHGLPSRCGKCCH
jgi:hypothetical protein